MGKLALNAAPTFTAKVAVPVPGADDVLVEMTFRHRTKTDITAFIASREQASDIDSFMDMVVGWELDAPFDREHAEKLLENYMGVAIATYRTYIGEIVKARLGN